MPLGVPSRRRPSRLAPLTGQMGPSVYNLAGPKPSLPRPAQPPGGTPATASPATSSPTSTPAQKPVDPVYDQTIGALDRRRDDTFAGLAQEQTGALANYGYGATFNDAGDVTGLSFDPANPFSRAALLRRNYQQAKTGTTNSLASRGQLYSGAMANAQNTNDFGYLQGEDALQRLLTNTLVGIVQRGRGAGTDYEFGAAQAGGESVNRAIAQDTGEQAFAQQPTTPATSAVKRGPRGEPAVTIRGKQYYRRVSDNKLIPVR